MSSPIETKPKLSFGVYTPEEGSFACFSYDEAKNKLSPTSNHYGDYWYGCREEFHGHAFTSKLQQFVFSHPTGKGPAIAGFMETLQDLLKIKAEDRLQIRPTADPTVSMVFMSSWWSSQFVRRAFLSIALRSGWKYNGKKEAFEKALYSQEYFKLTREAVTAFLRGRTQYIGKAPGNWVEMFDEEHKEDGEAPFYFANIQRLSFTE
jgi:hypothetical protein